MSSSSVFELREVLWELDITTMKHYTRRHRFIITRNNKSIVLSHSIIEYSMCDEDCYYMFYTKEGDDEDKDELFAKSIPVTSDEQFRNLTHRIELYNRYIHKPPMSDKTSFFSSIDDNEALTILKELHQQINPPKPTLNEVLASQQTQIDTLKEEINQLRLSQSPNAK